MLKRVAIVGCGAIAQIHGKVLCDMRDINIVATADIISERAEKFCKEFGGNPYNNFKDMLEREKIDVLHICTPHYLHTPMAVEALKRGINVLLEKPVSTSSEELDLLKTAIESSGKMLGVCFQNRYLPASKKAYELIHSGIAGKVIGTRAFVTWKRDELYYVSSGWRGSIATEGGGVMINQAIHTLDLMIWLVGNPINVEGTIHNHHLKGIIEVEDTAEIYLDFGNDVNGLFYASTGYCTDAPIMLEICCENMTLVISGDELIIDNKKENKGASRNILGKICWGVGHELLISDFYDKLKCGGH
jgi:UDP-N-acetyl-2-amino-2-deoxyglucuronate dehydrogenase